LHHVRTAKLFMNGRSQAVRLPAEFRFEGEEVFIHRDGDRVVLSPRPMSWDAFFESAPAATDDFLRSRDQPPLQPRDAL